MELELSLEELIDRAGAQRDRAPVALRETVYCYYIARFFVAYFEARGAKIPIQVWNDYRNALDHFFRHVTTSPEFDYNEPGAPHGQLLAMHGHTQRAALDMMKLITSSILDEYDEVMATYERPVLRMGDGGSFLKNLQEYYLETRTLYLRAKTEDDVLGTDADDNKDVLARYIDSTMSAGKLRRYIDTNQEHLESLAYEFTEIEKKGETISTKKAVLIGLGTNLLVGTAFFLLGLYWSNIVSERNDESRANAVGTTLQIR